MISGKQVDALGKRLRDGTATPADEDLLDAFLQGHVGCLTEIVARLQTLMLPGGGAVAPTPRVKTRGTLVEKLVRDGFKLSVVRDIAGARIVVGDSLDEQDWLVDRIVELFPRYARIVDRRTDPRSGYRAVHVAVRTDSCWAEIQVRTRLQHLWAEAFERFADRVGREVRYDRVSSPVLAQSDEQLRLEMLRVAELIGDHEASVRTFAHAQDGARSAASELDPEFDSELHRAEALLKGAGAQLDNLLLELRGIIESP